MKWLRFPFVIAGFVILFMLVGLFASLNSPWAKEQLEKAVRENCRGCSFEMESAQLTWRGLILTDVRFSSGKKGAKKLDLHVLRAVIRPDIWPLFKKQIRVQSAILFGPEVTYSEGDLPQKAAGGDDTPDVGLNKISIYNGKFVYVRDHKGTHGELAINDISGKILISGGKMDARFTARMGESGEFDLLLQAALKKPLEIDTELNVRNQNLDDLTVFLKPNAGVELKGEIVKAHAVSRARGDKLKTRLTVAFRDFSVRLLEMYDRTEAEAVFTNIGAALALKRENVKDSTEEQTSSVDSRRKKNESIVHFMLTGLKQAALDAAK